MDLDLRLSVLEQIYTLYDDFLPHLQMACGKQCAHCCTGNVIITTLEAYGILRRMTESARGELTELLSGNRGQTVFRPQWTVNQMAGMCARGEDIPDEAVPPNSGICPILDDDLCPIYGTRPFACRCMVSRTRCEAGGSADMPSLIVSVNNVVLQYIEHIDLQGYSGNFRDVMQYLNTEEPSPAAGSYPETPPRKESGLIANHPLTTLMIPPEHRNEIQPLLERFQRIRP